MLNNCSALILVKNDQYWLRFALESTKGLFGRYVIYDINSEDRTREVIENFVHTLDDRIEIYNRFLPMCPPVVQGVFRNSMIAEARTDWYFLLDGDEIYSKQSLKAIEHDFNQLVQEHAKDHHKIYGVIRRVEVSADLVNQYDIQRTHHRFYHRSAIWAGTHPGEVPFFEQLPKREFHFSPEAICYHFHGTARSPQDELALKRRERKAKATYQPGNLISFNLFETLPLLKTRFDDIEINPVLEGLQNESLHKM